MRLIAPPKSVDSGKSQFPHTLLCEWMGGNGKRRTVQREAPAIASGSTASAVCRGDPDQIVSGRMV